MIILPIIVAVLLVVASAGFFITGDPLNGAIYLTLAVMWMHIARSAARWRTINKEIDDLLEDINNGW